MGVYPDANTGALIPGMFVLSEADGARVFIRIRTSFISMRYRSAVSSMFTPTHSILPGFPELQIQWQLDALQDSQDSPGPGVQVVREGLVALETSNRC
jgi:hypothetical protein